jgi:sulfoxide reductase heme-binding subunit YedZ
VTRTRWIVLVVTLLALQALAARLGLVPDLIPRLAGTAAWTASRAAGVTAFAALALDVVFGLLLSTGLVDRWIPKAASVDVHRWLSGIALAMTAGHAAALVVDPSVHFDALDALVPMIAPYRAGAVALGVAALWGAIALQLSFGWRKRIGVRAWRALHAISFAVFVAAVIHGVAAGSDTGRLGLRALYLGAGGLVAALTAVRLAGLAWRPRATT